VLATSDTPPSSSSESFSESQNGAKGRPAIRLSTAYWQQFKRIDSDEIAPECGPLQSDASRVG